MNNGPNDAPDRGQDGNHRPPAAPPDAVPQPGPPGSQQPGHQPDYQQVGAGQPWHQQINSGEPGYRQPGPQQPPGKSLPPVPSAAWLAGLRSAALAYGLTLAASVAALALLVIGALIDDSGLEYAAPLAGIDVSPSAMLTILGLPFLLTGMALGGTAAAGSSESLLGFGAEVSTSMYVLPLALTGVAVAVLWWQGRRAERAVPLVGTGARWLVSAATGAMFAILALILALLFTVRDDGSTVTTAGFGLFFGALSLGLLATWAGRQSASPRPVLRFGPVLRALPELPSAGVVFGLHFTAATLIAGVFLVVAVLIEGSFGAALAAPLWVPTVSAWGYGALHFSGISASAGGFGGTGYIFDLPVWGALLAVLVTLVLAVAASAAWLVIRGRIPAAGDLRAWLVLPAVFGVGTLIVQLLSLATIFGGFGGFGIAAVLGMSWWSFLILALWGALIEASSRFLAPYLVRAVPAAASSRLHRLAAKAGSAAIWGPRPAVAQAEPGQPAPSGGFAAHSEAPAGMPPALTGAPDATAATAAPDTHVPGADGLGFMPGPDQGSSAAGAPSVPGAPLPEPKPLSPKAKRRLKIGSLIGGGALLLILALVVGYNVLAGSVFSPKVQVEKYLDALRDGDAEAALELRPYSGDGSQVALTNEIFGQAEGRITDYEILEVETRSNRADVAVDVYQDGASTTMLFSLASDRRTALLFNQWRIDSGPSDWSVEVSMPEGQDTISVNGVQVQPDVDADGFAQIALFPGEFRIAPPEGSEYVEYGEEQVVELTANSGYAGMLRFEAEFTEQLANDVTEQANALLAKCMEATEMKPAGCPNQAFAYRDPEDYRNVSWTLDKEPTYDVYDYYTGEIVFRSSDGRATVKYEENTAWRDGEEDWEAEEDTMTLYIDGEAELDGDSLTVTFSD